MDERFTAMYSAFGRESIAPEKLMRALVLQVLYGLRSERLLVEQLGQTKLRGIDKVGRAFTLTMTAVNLRRLPKLLAMHASG